MSGHTKGPWTFDVDDDGDSDVRAGDCSVAFIGPTVDDAESLANGHLIAAAPDLLLACEALLEHYGDGIDEGFDPCDAVDGKCWTHTRLIPAHDPQPVSLPCPVAAARAALRAVRGAR